MHPNDEEVNLIHKIDRIWTCHYWDDCTGHCSPVKAMRCPNYTTQPKTRKTTLF
jgi:hypothetical protein